ncbi:MAG: STAS domain-containing protein [Rhodospirillaceae bacterium]
MEYIITQTIDFGLILVSGALTFDDHRAFSHLITEISAAGNKDVVFDAVNVEHIDSSGFGMLLVANETCHKGGGNFSIRNASSEIKALAEHIHISHILQID